jgi:hypothetical protein
MGWRWVSGWVKMGRSLRARRGEGKLWKHGVLGYDAAPSSERDSRVEPATATARGRMGDVA